MSFRLPIGDVRGGFSETVSVVCAKQAKTCPEKTGLTVSMVCAPS
jgi:hypothetical protein